MNIEQAQKAYLDGHAGWAALIGDRLYPLVLPQDCTLLACTYQIIDGGSEQCLGVDPGYSQTIIQYAIYSKDYLEILAADTQLQAAMANQRNVVWGGAGGVNVGGVIDLKQKVDDYESDTRLFSRKRRYLIWHEG